MSPLEIGALTLAGLFALFNGVNDGGSLLATGLKRPTYRPLVAIAGLSLAVTLVPVLIGTSVARTLAERLVSFEGEGGLQAVLVATAGAVAVVMVLARRGVPTSLTLALLGGLVGAGLGAGLPVNWAWVGFALVLAALAPLAGLLGAVILSWCWKRLPVRKFVHMHLRIAHPLSFACQALAYGANDGQKMLAVAVLAFPGVAALSERPPWGLSTAIGLLFAIGAILGVRQYARRLSAGILPLMPVEAVTAQFAAAGSVLGSAVLGAPVSMTQAVTGGVVGTALGQRSRRVRWGEVGGILVAWIVTLPAAALVAGVMVTLVN